MKEGVAKVIGFIELWKLCGTLNRKGVKQNSKLKTQTFFTKLQVLDFNLLFIQIGSVLAHLPGRWVFICHCEQLSCVCSAGKIGNSAGFREAELMERFILSELISPVEMTGFEAQPLLASFSLLWPESAWIWTSAAAIPSEIHGYVHIFTTTSQTRASTLKNNTRSTFSASKGGFNEKKVSD